MIRIKESIDSDISKYKISIYLPYYEDDPDMCYTSTTVEAESEDEARKLGQRYIKSKKTSMNSKAWKDARIDNIKKIHDKAINEGTNYKRIARYGEFDNGYILHDFKKMTSDEAERQAKQASIKNPNDIYYVAYDDIMNSSSDLRWINGKSYNYSQVGISNGKPYIKESKIQESGFKTVFYYNDKKISAAKAKEIAGPDRLKRLVADAKEQYSEDPYVQNSYMVSGGMLTIEFV